MISPSFFFDTVKENGVGFFTGVPDSLLKSLCAYITEHVSDREHIIAVNEGCAVGIAAGYHLSTGKIPLVYMQNSGMGNATNPLLSLADSDVYKIPMLLVIGWRGEPGVHDEPQHVKQGKVTCTLLETMGIPYHILPDSEDECSAVLKECFDKIAETSSPCAIVVRKNTFEPYKLEKKPEPAYEMSREQAIEAVVSSLPDDTIFVSTTGMASRELYEIRERNGESHSSDFLTVGSMGHASQIALGIAMNTPERTVCCIDGDGAALMHMGGMATIGTISPDNYVHVVINNGVHDSVGGQPLISRQIDLESAARSFGYRNAVTVKTKDELEKALENENKPIFVQIMVHTGNRPDLGRPKSTPVENKNALMENIRGTL